jgi:hypothetical protein
MMKQTKTTTKQHTHPDSAQIKQQTDNTIPLTRPVNSHRL